MIKKIRSNNFISTSEIKSKGRGAYYKMLHEVQMGKLICIRRGVYAYEEQLGDTMIDLNLVVPGGIMCSFSAWNIHNLTTSIPQAYHVAIKRGRKIVLPKFPTVELHYITEELFELGNEEKIVSNYKIRIYNQERCVCDAIKNRNKIGQDVCSEILNNYLTSPNRNITLLMDYAEKLRISTIIKRYLEILL